MKNYKVYCDGGGILISKIPPGHTYFVRVKVTGHGYFANVIGDGRIKASATSSSELAVRRVAEKLFGKDYPYSIQKGKCYIHMEERWTITTEIKKGGE